MERILISSRSGPLDLAAAKTAAADAAARLRVLPEVSKVEEPVPAPDGTMLMVPVTMAGDPDTAEDRVQPLLDATAAVQRDHAALRVEEVGRASIHKALDATIGQDFQRAELFSLPVTLLILLVAFGALIAAGVPLLLALSAVGAAIGLSSLTSYLVPAQEALSSVILLIGMAVGVDYSLFYLRREREERAKGAGHLDAVEIAAATSGHAVVVSGIAVIISMAGMFLAGDAIFASFGVGSILVVAVSVLGSLTVLPALLAKLGRWVDRPRIPVLWRLTASRRAADGTAAHPRFWSAVLRPALRYPLVTLVISAGALVALAAPALGMTLKLTGLQDVPRSTPVMQAYDRMTAAFPSTGTDHVVVVKASPAQAAAVRAALERLSARTATDPLFAHDRRPDATVSPDGTVTMLSIGTPAVPGTADGRQGARGAVRGDGGDRRDHRLLRAREGEAALGRRVRAAADVPGDDVDVPLGRGGADRHRAEHALGRGRVRPAGRGLPAHLGGEAAGLPLQPRGHLVAAAVPLRGPVRALHGLPRVRGEPDPRGGAAGGTQPGGGRAGHHPVGRRGDERGDRDGGRVRHLRHPVHIGHEAARGRAGQRDPDRRDHHPGGGAAVADDPPGQRQLVGAALPAGAGPAGGAGTGRAAPGAGAGADSGRLSVIPEGAPRGGGAPSSVRDSDRGSAPPKPFGREVPGISDGPTVRCLPRDGGHKRAA